MTFYLGVGDTDWLWRTRVPVMVSRRRMARRPPKLKPRRGPWVLDSGGFTELSMHGGYAITAQHYALEASEFAERIGNLQWAAIQDFMCEPFMLARTGLTILEHQRRTVQSYLTLSRLAPGVPWLPVLQGFTLPDYMRCLSMYHDSHVSLEGRAVGIGSVCRRQSTTEAGEVFSWAHSEGLRVHAFGLKIRGARLYSQYLESSDSMAWSTHASRRPPLPGCAHKRCNHCITYALRWRRRVLKAISQ